MRTKRHATGTVRYDKRRRTWNYLWYDGKVRRSKRIGTKQDFPTKAEAWRGVQSLNIEIQDTSAKAGDTVQAIAAMY